MEPLPTKSTVPLEQVAPRHCWAAGQALRSLTLQPQKVSTIYTGCEPTRVPASVPLALPIQAGGKSNP